MALSLCITIVYSALHVRDSLKLSHSTKLHLHLERSNGASLARDSSPKRIPEVLYLHADLFYTHSSRGYPFAYECHLLSHIKQLGLNGRSLRGALLARRSIVYLLAALCLGATFFSWKSSRSRAQTKTNLRGALLACTFVFDLSMERF